MHNLFVENNHVLFLSMNTLRQRDLSSHQYSLMKLCVAITLHYKMVLYWWKIIWQRIWLCCHQLVSHHISVLVFPLDIFIVYDIFVSLMLDILSMLQLLVPYENPNFIFLEISFHFFTFYCFSFLLSLFVFAIDLLEMFFLTIPSRSWITFP